MPTAEENKRTLIDAGIPRIVQQLKRDLAGRGFDTSDAPSPISPANGELGLTCALPGVRFAISIRVNRTAKLLVTEASASWLKRLGLTTKGQKGANVPYWQPRDGKRRSIEEIVALLEGYRRTLSTTAADNSVRTISTEGLTRFARQNHGLTFKTLGRSRPFRICWEDERVVFYPKSGTPFYPDLERYVQLYNETHSLTPSDYPEDLWCNSYFVSIVEALQRGEHGESAKETENVVEDILSVSAPTETERKELISARVGQGKFRRDLLKLRGCCYVTGIYDHRLLRASHIKPWRDSTNQERLDPHNGLLLSPLYDHLFDQGLISFTDNGKMLISESLPSDSIETLRINAGFKGDDLGAATRGYLRIHRGLLR